MLRTFFTKKNNRNWIFCQRGIRVYFENRANWSEVNGQRTILNWLQRNWISVTLVNCVHWNTIHSKSERLVVIFLAINSLIAPHNFCHCFDFYVFLDSFLFFFLALTFDTVFFSSVLFNFYCNIKWKQWHLGFVRIINSRFECGAQQQSHWHASSLCLKTNSFRLCFVHSSFSSSIFSTLQRHSRKIVRHKMAPAQFGSAMIIYRCVIMSGSEKKTNQNQVRRTATATATLTMMTKTTTTTTLNCGNGSTTHAHITTDKLRRFEPLTILTVKKGIERD